MNAGRVPFGAGGARECRLGRPVSVRRALFIARVTQHNDRRAVFGRVSRVRPRRSRAGQLRQSAPHSEMDPVWHGSCDAGSPEGGRASLAGRRTRWQTSRRTWPADKPVAFARSRRQVALASPPRTRRRRVPRRRRRRPPPARAFVLRQCVAIDETCVVDARPARGEGSFESDSAARDR